LGLERGRRIRRRALYRRKWLYRGVPPMEVGVRELRNNLSRYLDRVRGGEEVVITDR
jgi:hypothetical protein